MVHDSGTALRGRCRCRQCHESGCGTVCQHHRTQHHQLVATDKARHRAVATRNGRRVNVAQQPAEERSAEGADAQRDPVDARC